MNNEPFHVLSLRNRTLEEFAGKSAFRRSAYSQGTVIGDLK